MTQDKYREALADFDASIRLESSFPGAYERIAWILATCPDDKFRSGEKAIKYATRGCALTSWQDPDQLATLAAAYAEAGDFTAARKWQAEAVNYAPEQYRSGFRKRLRMYQAAKPLRD